MCGIFGANKHLSEQELANALSLLDHRGPDSNGYERIQIQSSTVSFLHTRLAIQDLSPLGHQPMQSKNAKWWVTFNGEIYNHNDIRAELGIEFKSSSDTETLVEAISAYGVETTIRKLNGIFAFAALNIESGELYLVRDPYGIKPLYFILENSQLVFSSEVKPLLSYLPNRKINPDGLTKFLSLRYIPSESTLLEFVHRLKPGHMLKYNIHSGQHSTSHFSVQQAETYGGSYLDAVKDYERTLQVAIERQMLSDKPVGVLLSGGIDSAVVAATASQYDTNIAGFTVGFGADYDSCEIEDAADTAKHLGMRHEFVEVNPATLINDLPAIIKSIEEPLGTTSILPMWHLCKLAKQDVTVVLTGQGTDEPWGGYTRYKIELLLDKLPLLKSGIFKLPRSVIELFSGDGIRRGLNCLGHNNNSQRFRNAYSLFDDKQVEALTGHSANSVPTLDAIQYWLNTLAHQDSGASSMMQIDAKMNLADDLLLYGDKLSMAYALEARVPMLDTDLMKFVESLPIHYRTSLRKTKLAHRDASRELIPAAVINRPKKGFQIPFQEWSQTVWRENVEAALLDKNGEMANHLDLSAVEAIWNEHSSGKRDLSRQIFSLFAFSHWCDQILKH